MKFKKILVPYDGSEGSKNALKYAIDLVADSPDAELLAFRSLAGMKDITRMMGTGREGTGFIDDNTREHYERVRAKAYDQALSDMKADVAEIAGDERVSINCLVTYSPTPVEGILEAAEGCSADGIVMGCRGVSAIAGMLGSVSFGVIRSASIPVTVVK